MEDTMAERLMRGIEQARAGETRDLGDFTQYLEDDEDEE